MPELPEAEVVARQLRARILGARIKGCAVARPDIVREGLETIEWYRGSVVTNIERQGKTVILSCRMGDQTRHLAAELGMTGLLLFNEAPRLRQHTHLILSLTGGTEPELRYWNPRRFGRIYLLDAAGLERFLARRFGVDPLRVSYETFTELLKRRRCRLKVLLMHQQVIAGIGNIYANEILFRARLHPLVHAFRLRRRATARLYRAMREVLQQAIDAGGSSVRDFLAPDGTAGRYALAHQVYAKEGSSCPEQCGSTIVRIAGDRSSFYCPSCQRRSHASV